MCSLDLLSMRMVASYDLRGQVRACRFTEDDTNLVVLLRNESGTSGRLLVFTDPSTSLKLVDQMLRLGWEEDGLDAIM